MNVVWLKRDARLFDHEPIALAASQHEPILLLYIYEPCHLQSDTYHESHHTFINEGLVDLEASVRSIASGTGLTFRVGDSKDVLAALHAIMPIKNLYSHHEVGNAISRFRNARVCEWAESEGVAWIQCRQDGVSTIRHEALDEGSWAKKWAEQMNRPCLEPPARLELVSPGVILPGEIMDAHACGVTNLGERPGAQQGGETCAHAILASFLTSRGEKYSEELSSPLTGWDSCSRLSPYLAWGHISLRHTFQQLSRRQEEIRAQKRVGINTSTWLKSLAAHGARLRWRSHFSQKLHDEPSIEDCNMVTTYDELRTEFDADKYEAWLHGHTGYPMVDACMRSLHYTGWLNFRMRCMLVSFASYQLWLDWRHLTPAMARLFLDYEPGIHYPQFQMQSGTTGINANRIYNPAKQADDHAGHDYKFIRRWVPELKNVPTCYVAEPHKMPHDVQQHSGCIIGEDYPFPCVDNAESYRHAVREFARVRAQAETKAQAAAVYDKHGSRKRPSGSTLDAGNAKRSMGSEALTTQGQSGSRAAPATAPFTVEVAASGRASCRVCGESIAKGTLKICASAWARGGRIATNHHLTCFVDKLKVELCPSNRGKCKHSATPFIKGAPRIGYVTTSVDDINWICLNSAKGLLPTIVAHVPTWDPSKFIGYDALPGPEANTVSQGWTQSRGLFSGSA